MIYGILLDHLQTERNYFCVTDFGDLAYCQSVREDDGTFVLLSKARYQAGASTPTTLHTAQGDAEPGRIVKLTERT